MDTRLKLACVSVACTNAVWNLDRLQLQQATRYRAFWKTNRTLCFGTIFSCLMIIDKMGRDLVCSCKYRPSHVVNRSLSWYSLTSHRNQYLLQAAAMLIFALWRRILLTFSFHMAQWGNVVQLVCSYNQNLSNTVSAVFATSYKVVARMCSEQWCLRMRIFIYKHWIGVTTPTVLARYLCNPHKLCSKPLKVLPTTDPKIMSPIKQAILVACKMWLSYEEECQNWQSEHFWMSTSSQLCM